MQLNFDSRGLLATRNEVHTQENFTNRFHEDFLQSNQCVVAPQNIGNTAIERLTVINYFIFLNFQDVVH